MMKGKHMQTPDRKVGLGTAIGVPAGIIAAWGLGLTGVVVPPEVAAALGAVITGIVAYMIPNK